MEKRGVTAYGIDKQAEDYNPYYEQDITDRLSTAVKEKSKHKHEQQSINKPSIIDTTSSREWVSRSL